MKISELLKSIKEKELRHKESAIAAWDAFKGNTGMIPKEEQTIGNLKYAIRMNAEEMEPNEINFVDFNGMVLSMTIEEVMQLTEMPKPNEYYNLTFEKWSETLEEIQDGRCHTVGATYHTTDGYNYFVIITTKDNQQIKITAKNQYIDWGDGASSSSSEWVETHTYEKRGRYTIKTKVDNVSELGCCLVEAYYRDSVDRSVLSFRNCSNLLKVCIPDNGIGTFSFGYGLKMCDKLKSFIYGDSVIGGSIEFIYSHTKLMSLKYFVADGANGLYEPQILYNLQCLSLKNISTIGVGSDQLCLKLKNLSFDKITDITKSIFTYGGLYNNKTNWNQLESVDLPETLATMANNVFTMGVKNVYLRTLIPPTLAGTNAFSKKSWYTPSCTIHVRKDATYTDTDGNTWTGLEAYAHATNWATLYANTTYYTFIDDL